MRSPKNRAEFSDQIALCITELIFQADTRFFLDSIYRLLELSDPEDIKRFLAKRGISWNAPLDKRRKRLIDDEEPTETTQDNMQVRVAVGTLLSSLIYSHPSSGLRLTASETRPASLSIATIETTAPALPPLNEVTTLQAEPSLTWTPLQNNPRNGGSRGASTSVFRPPSPQQTARNLEIGQRAEELVYENELVTVTALGRNPALVVWQARYDPGSPYDIRSVDKDGAEIWIEVKATTGTDGRFTWSVAEFQLAVEKRNHYQLVRVYQADSASPTIRRFSDPVGLFTKARMRLDIADLSAEVEPLK